MPTLVLDGGEALIESTAILDYLDELVGPDKAMIARAGRSAGSALRSARWRPGLATRRSACVYERVLRKEPSKLWVDRCEAQIGGVLEVLEKERAAVETPYWFGDAHRPCRYRGRLRAALHRRGASALFHAARYPALAAHAARCEALPAFHGNRAAAGAAERGLMSFFPLPLWGEA